MPHRYMVTAGLGGSAMAFLVAGSQGLVVQRLELLVTGTGAIDVFLHRVTSVVGGMLQPIFSLDDPSPAALATIPYTPTSYTDVGAQVEIPLSAPVSGLDLTFGSPIEVASGNGLRMFSTGGTGAFLVNIYFEE